MRKTCGNTVGGLRVSTPDSTQLPTPQQSPSDAVWVSTLIYTRRSTTLHTVLSTIQNYYSYLLGRQLSSVSTGPTSTSTNFIYLNVNYSNGRCG
jgi:hypothetical protein